MNVLNCVSGQGEPSWTQGLRSEDFQLLCQDGTRSPVKDYEKCHLARVPSRGIVVHKDISSSVVYNMLREGLVCFSYKTGDILESQK